jgi:hypothetical protein
LNRFVRNDAGASAAEFALVVPLMLIFLFGIIDAGWFTWQINQAEKATQMGARMAVVTSPVAPGLTTTNYIGTTVGGVTLAQGDQIPAAALGVIRCNSSSCTCATSPCPGTLGYDAAAFALIASRMKSMYPYIQPANVVVEYRGSGIGFAGDPSGMEIATLTTVKVQNLQYTPFTFMVFNQRVSLPSFAYTLTMEDGQGTRSN